MILTVDFTIENKDLLRGLIIGCDEPSIKIELIQLEDTYPFNPRRTCLSARINEEYAVIWLLEKGIHNVAWAPDENDQRGFLDKYESRDQLIIFEGELRIIDVNQKTVDSAIKSCESQIDVLCEKIEWLRDFPVKLRAEVIKDLVI
jgi:hypothetical protein